MNVDGIVRAVRRMRRLSQRELAELAKLPTSTIDRLESGYTRDPRLGTLEAIFSATGYSLVVVNQFGRVLSTDDAHDRLRDRAWRRFPAHLEIEPVIGELRDGWWGWRRIAWVHDDPRVPEYSYTRRRRV
jgi:transcriptional regulator with XRE-family HTH domain